MNCEPLTVEPRVIRGGAPYHVARWIDRTGNNTILKKSNELLENFSLDSKFILIFEILPFKVFFNVNFSKYYRYFESSNHFQKKQKKKENSIFCGL